MKSFATFLVVLILCGSSVSAQTTFSRKLPKGYGSIAGQVCESEKGALLPYSTVVLLDSEGKATLDGIITKNKGEFVFSELPAGDYKIRCAFMGYQTYESGLISIKDSSKNINLGRISLKSKSIETSSIVVTAEKNEVVYKLDKKIVNIADNPNAQGGRLSDALMNISSVSIDMEGNVSIRGSQNFQVLIDGKPTLIPGNDILRQIPADAVENIELITNPSAKYDPEGTAGIVNIVLKKASLNGINGILNGNLGNKEKYSGDALFNYRYDSFNFYTALNYQNFVSRSKSELTRETYNLGLDTSIFVNPIVNRKTIDINTSIRGGVEYSFSEKDFASISTNINLVNFERIFPSKINEWTEPNSIREYIINNDIYKVDGSYSTINSYYQHNFNGEEHKLTINLNNVIWNGGGDETADKFISDESFKPKMETRNSHRGIADSRTYMSSSKIDYTLPINSQSRLEAGYSFDYTQDFSDYLYQNLDINSNVWLDNGLYTNNTKFYHTINAIYTTFASNIVEFDVQIGLRAEYYNRRLFQETNNIAYTYEKINLFPSLHISKSFNPSTQLQFGYSRRVQRPDVYVLNPFPDYADDYVVSIGNPNLMPEFTDSYELNFSKHLDFLFLSVQTYLRTTDNAISRVTKLSDGKLLISSENIGNNIVYGAELSANLNLFKKLRWNINVNLYRFKIDKAADISESNSGNVFDANSQLMYSVLPSTLVQFNVAYNGPRFLPDGEVEATYGFGFAIRHYLLDKKLTLFMTGRNIFNTWNYKSRNERINFRSYGYMKPEALNLSLGFSLNINNYENKVRPEDRIERSNVGSSGGY